MSYVFGSEMRHCTVRYTAEQNQEAVRVSQGVREGNDRGHECVRGRGWGSLGPVS